jgi:hypothetical protein
VVLGEAASGLFQGLAELGPGFGKVTRPIVLLGKELQTVGEITGDHVEVGVKDHLASSFEIIHAEVEALGVEDGAEPLGHTAADKAHLHPEVVRKVQQVLVMVFRDNQGVAVVHRGDIQEGQYLGGLENPFRRLPPGGDGAKDTVLQEPFTSFDVLNEDPGQFYHY